MPVSLLMHAVSITFVSFFLLIFVRCFCSIFSVRRRCSAPLSPRSPPLLSVRLPARARFVDACCFHHLFVSSCSSSCATWILSSRCAGAALRRCLLALHRCFRFGFLLAPVSLTHAVFITFSFVSLPHLRALLLFYLLGAGAAVLFLGRACALVTMTTLNERD